MKPQNVDLVLVVDASESMRPCFENLRNHLLDLIYPLRQANFTVRFGLVAYAAGRGSSGSLYDHNFIGGSGPDMIERLYRREYDSLDFFSPEPNDIARVLTNLKAEGNESTLLALDVAADMPFGAVDSTLRVIAVFTDERLEDGVDGAAPLRLLPDLIQKLHDRKILLFMAAPQSAALDEIATLDGCQVEVVRGGDGLSSVDFGKLLRQMGKSISVSTLQLGGEKTWKKALFGQDSWGHDRIVSADSRQVILAVGESARLPSATLISSVRVTLKWTAPVDLDLHAFVRTLDGRDRWVYYGNRTAGRVKLDRDAGIGDKAGRNEENLDIESFVGIKKILFATKIFSKGGCYWDYDGKIILQTGVKSSLVVPLSSLERADWCVIASVTVDEDGATVTNINRVTAREPSLDEI